MRPSPSPTTNASHSRAQRQTVLSGRRPVSSARGIKLQLFAQKQRGNLLVALVPALVLACLGCSGAVPSIPNYSTAATLVAGEGTAAFVRTPSVFRYTGVEQRETLSRKVTESSPIAWRCLEFEAENARNVSNSVWYEMHYEYNTCSPIIRAYVTR